MRCSRVSAGMVGLGLAARAHAKGYVQHPKAELVAVCDLDRARAEQFAAEYQIPAVYTDYEEMLEDPAINVIDIATPTFLHAKMAKQAALAGKHVHCEKPFCRSVSEGMEAVNAARQSLSKLVVGETYVFVTSHMKARELIEAGEIGCPLQIRQRHGAWIERRERSAHNLPSDRSWRIDPVMSGGGDYAWIFDHAVHLFATAEYLMADLRVSEVYSVGSMTQGQSKRTGASHDPYTTAEVDIPIITWRYDDPACQGVWMRAERLNGKYDYMRGFSTIIVGEKGMIEVLGEGGHNLLWDGKQQHLILHREGKDTVFFRFDEGGDDIWQSDISYYSCGHINQVHHLIECVLADTEPRYTGEDGVHTVRCTLAAIRSAQLGRPVSVHEISGDYTAYGVK